MKPAAWLIMLAAAASLAAPVWAGAPMQGAGESLQRNGALCGGGISAATAVVSIDDGLGEPLVSSASGAGFRFFPGLMSFMAQPGSVTSIVAVSKDTGDLELSWSAPGIDGLAGEALSGYYRIDASSDPALAAAFAPTTVLAGITTEISTAGVVPGSAQSYTLTGLLPDTTYYTRIYLSDARKYFAETSTTSNESTLSRLPNFPTLSGVFATSVTFTWVLPGGGAQGYDIDGSTTNFGALSPGGLIVSSATFNGAAVALTVTGLSPNSTYYFKLGSLNWQDQGNFNAVIATVTSPGNLPLPPYNLVVSPDALGHAITLTWSNPVFANQAGVLVVVSTSPITTTPSNGSAYALGTVFSDGSVVADTAAAVSHSQGGLALDTTEYFSLYEQNTGHTYSVAVSTYAVLDLPPMAPPGLWADTAGDPSTITIHWSAVSSKLDGTSFKNPSAPVAWELDHYDVYRATSIVRPSWVFIGSAPVSALSFAAGVPIPGLGYYYKVVSLDAYQSNADAAMVLDSYGNLYALDQDLVTRLEIPAALSAAVLPSGNSYGAPLLIRALDLAADPSGGVVKSVDFSSVRSPSDAPAPNLGLASAGAIATLGYSVAGGQFGPLDVSNPSSQLGLFWFNGQSYVKFFGSVDPQGQTVSALTASAGRYQIKTFLRDASFSFDVSQRTNQFITPNGDGLNDVATFVFDNPRLSAFTGNIYDAQGAFVSAMRRNPKVGPDNLMWDGKANGRVVAPGVYIYKIQAEGKTFTGTLVVVR